MKPMMKKLFALLFVVALFGTIFVSCAAPSDSKVESATETASSETGTGGPSAPDTALPIHIAVLSGSTGYGAVKLMDDAVKEIAGRNYQVTREDNAKIIQDSLIAGEVDIAALPTNKASMIYNATDKSIQVIAVNTLGVLSLVTTNGETITDIADLRGKTVCIPEEPSYILRALCEKAGLTDGTDVTIETYATPSQLLAAVIKGQVAYAVLPEPLLSTAMSKKDTIRISLNLSDEWAKVFDGASLMQGCLVVRTAWAKEHPAELARFLSDYEASIRFVNENVTEASLLIETYFGTAAAVAANAIPHCNLVYIAGNEMAEKLGEFYRHIQNMPGVNMGEALPDTDFYYIVK